MNETTLATLAQICEQRQISREWYAQLRKRGLVPGWTRAQSLGRGCGRRYLYDLQEAIRSLDLIRAEQDQGRTLDQIARKHARWLLPGQEYEDEVSLTKLLREIRLNRWNEILRVSIAVRKAVELGAFADLNTAVSTKEILFQVRDKLEIDTLKELLREFVTIHKKQGPGNAIVWALDKKALRSMAFTAPVEPHEDAHASEWTQYKKALNEWEVERQRLETSARMWATWPPPVAPGHRHGITPAGKHSR